MAGESLSRPVTVTSPTDRPGGPAGRRHWRPHRRRTSDGIGPGPGHDHRDPPPAMDVAPASEGRGSVFPRGVLALGVPVRESRPRFSTSTVRVTAGWFVLLATLELGRPAPPLGKHPVSGAYHLEQRPDPVGLILCRVKWHRLGGMPLGPDGGRVRIAELVATLSYAAGLGQPMEHCLRQTVIALRLADLVDADDDDREATYHYLGLLSKPTVTPMPRSRRSGSVTTSRSRPTATRSSR